jgi:hypothetical protein
MGATVGVALFVGGGYMLCCMPVLFAGPGDDMLLLTMSLLVPYLLAFPQIVCVEGLPGHEGGVMVAAYLLGNIFYAVAALVLTSVSIGDFERRAGRVHGRPPGWRTHGPLGAAPPVRVSVPRPSAAPVGNTKSPVS